MSDDPFDAPDVEFLNSPDHLRLGLPFSQAVRVGSTVYLSGQLGNVPGKLELVPGGIRAEARQTMENIQTALADHGLTMNDIVKCTVMLADMGEWAAFNEVYRGYFTGNLPARSAFGCNGLALGGRLELECMAVIRG